MIAQKNPMIQVASCEQALIKTNRRPIQNHQSKTMFLFETYTLESDFDRHLDHMVSCQGMQSGLPIFVVGEFGAFKIFMQDTCFTKPDFYISPTGNVQNRPYFDGISSH